MRAQGRAGLVALRKSRGAAGAVGKFYKGGFEPKMNRREASLILQLKYGGHSRERTAGTGLMDYSERMMTKEKIRANHRKLMLLNHPDRGGR